MLDPKVIKEDFPILNREINGKPLVYLDSGATSQKPRQVLDAEREYYEQHNANVHRGAHTLGDEATQIYEKAREKVAQFIGASRPEEIIFVRNTTEAINLVAYAWGLDNLKSGDLVVSTLMEHHANLVPWQEVCAKTGATLRWIGLTDDGRLDLSDLDIAILGAGADDAGAYKVVVTGPIGGAAGSRGSRAAPAASWLRPCALRNVSRRLASRSGSASR